MKDLEHVRAYVDDVLAPDARAEFEAHLASDGELAHLVDAYRLIARATADAAPPRTSACPDVRPRRSRAVLRFAAAALLLLAAAAGLWLLRDRTEARPVVRLAAIPFAPLAAPDVPDWPRSLAAHETANDSGLVWAGDADDAVDVARAAERPLLVFVGHPFCPLCKQYEAGPFRDGAVARAADGFVLLKVGVDDVPDWVARDLPRGWPILAVFEPGGKRIAGLTGYHPGRPLATWLGRAAGERRAPDWAELRAAARKLVRAEETDDAAERLRLWREVEESGAGSLRAVARVSRLRLEARAQEALFAARDAVPSRAAEILAAAAAEFEGTPFGDDLGRVLDHVGKYGSFPSLRESAGG